MRKQIICSALLWLMAGSILSIFTLKSDSLIGLSITAMWIILPFITFFMNLFIKKQVTADLELPVTVEKKKDFYGKLILRNQSSFSVPKVLCKVRLTNLLTKETSEIYALSSAAGKEQQIIDLKLSSEHCGYLLAEIPRIYLMDWIGFLPVPCQCQTKEKASVLPDTFSPEVSLTLSSTVQEDAQSWSPYQKGSDQTELFALRDYVSGDNLKQIHWKLSSKRQKLIVKEASLPVEKSLLIFWDKNTREASGKEIDAMAECMVSLCQSVLQQGISFTAGWTEGAMPIFETIDTDAQLLAVIPRMLKHGAQVSENMPQIFSEISGVFGKTIYLAGSYPETDLFHGDISLLLCTDTQETSEFPAICFQADTYEEDLEMIEL